MRDLTCFTLCVQQVSVRKPDDDDVPWQAQVLTVAILTLILALGMLGPQPDDTC